MGSHELEERVTQVLVVAEDRKILKLLQKTLAAYGYEVATAATGRAAMRSLNTRDIGVTVCDSELSSIRAQELIRTICHVFPQVPVVVMTALEDPDVIGGAIKAGAIDYVVKPLIPSTLQFVLENSVQRKKLDSRWRAMSGVSRKAA